MGGASRGRTRVAAVLGRQVSSCPTALAIDLGQLKESYQEGEWLGKWPRGGWVPTDEQGSPARMGSSLLHAHLQAPQKERATLTSSKQCAAAEPRGATL